MGKKIEDLKEMAPCGMVIHYTVDENDLIAYDDINGRGVLCDKCKGCTWRCICNPSEKVTQKKMSRNTYIDLYNLIDDTMREAGERVEEICDELVKMDASPKCVLVCDAIEDIKKYRKKYNEMQDLLRRFEEEVEEPEKGE